MYYDGVHAPLLLSTTTVPSAFLIVLIQASVEPGFIDGHAMTSISSPCLSESLVSPSAIIDVTDASSPTQCVTSPALPLTSQTTYTCGFLHRYSTTTPRVVIACFE